MKYLREQNVDFLLLNECGHNGKCKINGYKTMFSNNKELGIIYKEVYQVDPLNRDLCSPYDLVVRVNTNNRSFILFVTYAPPDEKHKERT